VYCEEGKLKYDPQKVIKVYVGINKNPISELTNNEKRKMWEYSVDKVIKHPNWDGTGLVPPDLVTK
jgi:hypothetical protein